jgi:hypothetical protein
MKFTDKYSISWSLMPVQSKLGSPNMVVAEDSDSFPRHLQFFMSARKLGKNFSKNTPSRS